MTPEWKRLPCEVPEEIAGPVALRCRVICRCTAQGEYVTILAHRHSGGWYHGFEHDIEILAFYPMPVPPDMVQ